MLHLTFISMNCSLTKILCKSAVLAIAGCLITGCESVRKSFGGGKNTPDEFVVFKRPPLSLPPAYGLRPPIPGKDRPQKISPKDQAREAILGKEDTVSSGRQITDLNSRGIEALMTRTGAKNARPDIRRIVNQESSVIAEEDQPFVNKLIFWAEEKGQPGVVVDAKKENQRIMSNDALGKAINEGETPKVKRKPARKGLLDF